jgi:hypothetical protein
MISNQQFASSSPIASSRKNKGLDESLSPFLLPTDFFQIWGVVAGVLRNEKIAPQIYLAKQISDLKDHNPLLHAVP